MNKWPNQRTKILKEKTRDFFFFFPFYVNELKQAAKKNVYTSRTITAGVKGNMCNSTPNENIYENVDCVCGKRYFM